MKNQTNYLTFSQSNSPFFSISTPYLTILGILTILELSLSAVTCLYSSNEAMSWNALANFFELLLQRIPILFYQPTWGWFHPLILPTILGILKDLPLRLPQLLSILDGTFSVPQYALEFHAALPGWDSEQLTWLIAVESVLNCVGLVAYYCGFFFAKTPGIPCVSCPKPSHLNLRIILVVVFSLMIGAIYIQIQGGIDEQFSSWGESSRFLSRGGKGPLIILSQMGTWACFLWLAVQKNIERNPIFWVCSGLLLSMGFILSGSRGGIVFSIFTGILIWMLRERKVPSLTVLVTFFMAMLILLGVLGNFRQTTWKGQANYDMLTDIKSSLESTLGSEEQESELDKRTGSKDGTLPILALVPEKVDYLYGKSYEVVPVFMIPRYVWPDKPRGVGSLVVSTFFVRGDDGSERGGIPPGPIGESYWNFGIPGILIVMFLYGAFHQWLAKLYCEYNHYPAIVVLYLYTLIRFSPTSTFISKWLLTIIPAIIMMQVLGVLSFKSKRNS